MDGNGSGAFVDIEEALKSYDIATESFGQFLSNQRKQRSWSRKDIAGACNTTVASISRIENGQQVPSPELVMKIISVLNINILAGIRAYCNADLRCGRLISTADYFLDKNQPTLARIFIRKAFVVNKRHYGQRYNGDINRLVGRWAFAVNNYALACKAFAMWEKALNRKGSKINVARAQYDYGMALGKVDHVYEALTRLHSAQSIFHTMGMNRREAYTHWAIATILIGLGSFSEARQHYRSAQEYLSNDEWLYAKAGELLARIGEGERNVIQELQPLTSSSIPAIRGLATYAMGVCTRQQERWSQAIGLFEDLLRDSPTVQIAFSTHLELAMCYLITGGKTSAQQHIRDAEKLMATTSTTDILTLDSMASRLGIPISRPLPSRLFDPDWEHRATALMVMQCMDNRETAIHKQP